MGLFSKIFGGGDTVKGVMEGAGTLIKDVRSAITGEISPEAKAELMLHADELQSAVNLQEAKHPSIFVAGWRPFVGWTCGVGLAYNYIIAPLATAFAGLAGKEWELLPLDTGELITLLITMLGVAGLRTFEKSQGTIGEH